MAGARSSLQSHAAFTTSPANKFSPVVFSERKSLSAGTQELPRVHEVKAILSIFVFTISGRRLWESGIQFSANELKLAKYISLSENASPTSDPLASINRGWTYEQINSVVFTQNYEHQFLYFVPVLLCLSLSTAGPILECMRH